MRKVILLFMLIGLLMSAGISAAQTEQVYIVQARDNITGIARAFNVTPDAILIRNNIIDPNRIRVGQELIIPNANTVFPRQHIVGPGETLFDIALRYNTTDDALIQLNRIGNANVLFPGQVLQLPPVGGSEGNLGIGGGGAVSFPFLYIVDTGETLFSIAQRFGTTVNAIVIANGIPNPNYVQAGMVITIPDPNSVPVVPPVPTIPPPANITYIVQAGDFLEGIAARFNTTVEAIRTFNGLSPADAIFPGQVLVIPPTGGPVTQPPSTGYVTLNGFYTVRAGDTLFRIAAAFNRNIYDIAEANGLLNLNSIFVGQALRIPGY